jgi:hypothetical protein
VDGRVVFSDMVHGDLRSLPITQTAKNNKFYTSVMNLIWANYGRTFKIELQVLKLIIFGNILNYKNVLVLNNSLVSCNFECQLLWYENMHYDLVVIVTVNKVLHLL